MMKPYELFLGHVFTEILTETASILPAQKNDVLFNSPPFNYSQPFKQNITTDESCNHKRTISSGAHQTIKISSTRQHTKTTTTPQTFKPHIISLC